jgi:protein arginine kinase
VLNHAHSINSKEALNLLSAIKLGVDLELFPGDHRYAVDELFIETQPAHLQKGAQTQKMTADERDTLRAALIRAKLKQVPEPDIAKIATPASGSSKNDE